MTLYGQTDKRMIQLDVLDALGRPFRLGALKITRYTVESFIFVGLKFRGFQISDKLVGI